jgi:hypothetical protein
LVELVEALQSEQSLHLYYQQELEEIDPLPYSQEEQKMQLLDRLNHFLECATNLMFFGKFKPTSPWKF